MERRIVVGDRHQPLLKQIVDVGAGDVECDELRPFFDPRCGGVSARCLAANFRLAATPVDQQLVGSHTRFDRIQCLAGNTDRPAGRVL